MGRDSEIGGLGGEIRICIGLDVFVGRDGCVRWEMGEHRGCRGARQWMRWIGAVVYCCGD